MKLILCKKCDDVFKLSSEEIRTCSCGACRGKYIDNINAWYRGNHAVPIGLNNKELFTAVYNQPEYGQGEVFEAFVIAKNCKTFKNRTKEKV